MNDAPHIPEGRTDPSPTMHDPRTQSAGDYAYRDALEAYLREGVGSWTEKLENFPKYAPRQHLSRFLDEHPHLVISCLYLDFDIFAPTRLALEHLFPRIPRGGVVVFDELNEEAFPGETLALIETIGIQNLRLRRFPHEPRISYAIVGE